MFWQNLSDGIIPSRPTIPRRNSASKQQSLDADNSYLNSTLNGPNNFQLLDDENFESEELNRSIADSSFNNSKKFDTMPNLRTSAKNRRKLEKLFAIGTTNNTMENGRYTDTENNLYLSKLKAAERNNELNTSRYTPSNPESGVFSMSDYDQIENSMRMSQSQNRKQQSKCLLSLYSNLGHPSVTLGN